MKEYVKHLLIRTPLEKPLMQMQHLLTIAQPFKNPGLHEIQLESQRIDRIVEQILSKSSNCIDIGAHLGSVLSQMLHLAPHGRHMAFEPTPYKANWLKQKFPDVEVLDAALSDQEGEATFYLNTNLSGFSGLNPHMSKNHEIEELVVQCKCLDNLVSPDRRIDFIKMDVEGNELGVMRGAKKLLERDRPTLLFECTKSGLSCSGYTLSQIFEFLTQLNYAIFLPKTFLEKGKPLAFGEFERALQYPFQAFNFFATQPEYINQSI
jgi:FkbM family methyltransferase